MSSYFFLWDYLKNWNGLDVDIELQTIHTTLNSWHCQCFICASLSMKDMVNGLKLLLQYLLRFFMNFVLFYKVWFQLLAEYAEVM